MILLKGKVNHLQHATDIMEVKAFNIIFFDILDVAFIVNGKDQVGDAVTFGSKHLFLDTTHGQHATTQGNLARHGQLALHLALREGRCQGSKHSDTRRRAILGCGTFRHMDMDIPSIEHLRVDLQQ